MWVKYTMSGKNIQDTLSIAIEHWNSFSSYLNAFLWFYSPVATEEKICL